MHACMSAPECHTRAGTIALSGALVEALDALCNARIPREWLARSWEASALGAWFAGLLARHDQLARWLSGGRPKAYWLTGFFNPQVHPAVLHSVSVSLPLACRHAASDISGGLLMLSCHHICQHAGEFQRSVQHEPPTSTAGRGLSGMQKKSEKECSAWAAHRAS